MEEKKKKEELKNKKPKASAKKKKRELTKEGERKPTYAEFMNEHELWTPPDMLITYAEFDEYHAQMGELYDAKWKLLEAIKPISDLPEQLSESIIAELIAASGNVISFPQRAGRNRSEHQD
jgi:hypothetical protein